jgi:hypothetical protein
MLAIIAIVGLISVVSYFATTTPEQRAASRRRFARWNPLWIAILIIELGIIFWPWSPPSH